MTEKDMDAVYEDRNLLACAVAQLAPISGWKEDPENPEEWAIVWVETSEGQVSWHVPKTLAADLAPPERDSGYDGYDRDEKNRRLTDWCLKGCPY